MTAEIGILNRMAVALAADSAVTIGTQDGHKIYNSANKLFSLSKYHPVGIMIYGNAELMDVPWETIIKMFRSKLGYKKYDRLEEYCNSFLSFVEKFFTEDDQTDHLKLTVMAYLNVITEDIKEAVRQFLCNNSQITLKQTKKIIAEVIKEHYNQWSNAETLAHLDETFIEDLLHNFSDVFEKLIKIRFEKVKLPKKLKEKLIYICACLFAKKIFPTNITGIVIAGFGEKEIFPSLYSYEIECVVNNKLKYQLDKKTIVSKHLTASIIPFAQSDMVDTFMQGIDPFLKKHTSDYLHRIFEEYPGLIIDTLNKTLGNNKVKKELRQALTEISMTALNYYNEKIQEYQQINHIDPVLDIVSVLPKDELAAMAETLVNLTSFKRKISKNAETVGGPVDVAVISKGDGFIWIKRKHYFKPELNHQFISKYFKEGEKSD